MHAGIKEKKDRKGSERVLFFSQHHHGSARSGALSGCLQAAFMCFCVLKQTPSDSGPNQSWCIFRPTSRFDLPFHLSMHSFVKSRLMWQKWPVSLCLMEAYFHLLPYGGHKKILGFALSFNPKCI